MPAHHSPLIATIAAGLVLAYIFGLLANRLRIQPLVGYLLAGVAVGPYTPGFIADQALAGELAEIGVILLMFGVGLHFSLKDLASVAKIAVPGALLEIGAATALGSGLAWILGWGPGAMIVFGLSLSVASTAVVVRGLQERRMLETERGRIIVGWLVVEDLAMVIALVVLPALAGLAGGRGISHQAIWMTLGITLAKVAGFIAFMLVAGRRIIPWVMHYTAHTGSRELFRLAVYATALGIAYVAARFFDASFALGAFVAGIVLGDTKLSQRATEEALPLRDAFAVLFFVSVGMLFNPAILLQRPLAVLGTLVVIMLGKTAVVYLALRLFRYRRTTALSVAARLGLIGEFSFILIGLGVTLHLVPAAARDLVLAGAILSILLNPVMVHLADSAVEVKARVLRAMGKAPPAEAPAEPPAPEPEPIVASQPEPEAAPPTSLTGHDIVVGHGRVGRLVAAGLIAAGRPVLVIEDRSEARQAAREAGAEVIDGNAATPAALALANLPGAERLFVTIPESFEAGQVVQQARAANPKLEILARAHSDACYDHLEKMGSDLTILGEREIAHRMLDRAQVEKVTESA
ncbi:Kef family K(+) transporter [Rhodovarius crocodyli]|uniref:Kef family K(+) transporter n=1 Tax=Rhodovarius crocodyli TaxID=1979269 RepID=A0A437MES8_9PROT|nr:YbaL family putative K(+) efflux transporter [Rhodovarius crocodyli]RVT96133.1 Kef family K(+) transporter [Rhodovarius crocodyli]